MKIKYLYILVLFAFLCNYQVALGATSVKPPQQIRKFDDDFKERYSGNKYNYEGRKIVKQSKSGSGKYEDYKNGKPKIKEEKNNNPIRIDLGPFAWVCIIALLIAICYLVFILLNEGGTGLFSSNKNTPLNNYEEITADNIENTDINTLIRNAEKAKNYRLAIRYYYLLILKTLSLKNHIKFEDDKTNSEYLNELQDKPFNKKFAYTLYLYNYIWYGEFSLNTLQYEKAKVNFTNLINQVK